MEVGCQNTSAVHHTQYYPSINHNHQHTTFETLFTSITPPLPSHHHKPPTMATMWTGIWPLLVQKQQSMDHKGKQQSYPSTSRMLWTCVAYLLVHKHESMDHNIGQTCWGGERLSTSKPVLNSIYIQQSIRGSSSTQCTSRQENMTVSNNQPINWTKISITYFIMCRLLIEY